MSDALLETQPICFSRKTRGQGYTSTLGLRETCLARDGQGFEDRTEAAKRIARAIRLRTPGRVDHFVDAIAKHHIGNLGIKTIV